MQKHAHVVRTIVASWRVLVLDIQCKRQLCHIWDEWQISAPCTSCTKVLRYQWVGMFVLKSLRRYQRIGMFVFWQIIHKGTQIQMCTHKDTHTQMCELSSTTLCRLSLYIWKFLIQNPFTSGSLSELSKYNNFLRFYPPSNESGKELLLALVNTNFVPIQQLNLDTLYASFGKST